MAVTAYWYGSALMKALNKEIDWAADALKVALCTSDYVPAQDTHDYFDDITNEVVGDGYVAGGAELVVPTIGYTAGTNVIKLDATDTAWATATITARYAIIYDSTPGSAATNPLIAYVDFGANVSSTAAEFKITWNGAGIATVTPAAPA